MLTEDTHGQYFCSLLAYSELFRCSCSFQLPQARGTASAAKDCSHKHLVGKRRLESDVPPTCAHAPNASDGLMAITGVDMADAVLVSSPVDMVTME